MPIYEYVCTECDHRADILHGINDPGPHFCPSCGADGTMRKQFAPPAIHYKGSGWAKKDRGGSSSTKASRASTSSSSESKADTPASKGSSDTGSSDSSSSSGSSPAGGD